MRVVNKKASFNYKLFDRYEAGITLLGGEVKAIRKDSIDLGHSFAKVVDSEVYLVNASIPIEGKKDYNSTRSRKLLMHKGQIISIKSKIKAKKLTIVPTKVYTKGRLIKVEIALAKAKRKFEKKEAIKRRETEKEIERELRAH